MSAHAGDNVIAFEMVHRRMCFFRGGVHPVISTMHVGPAANECGVLARGVKTGRRMPMSASRLGQMTSSVIRRGCASDTLIG